MAKEQWVKMESWRPYRVQPRVWVQVRGLENGAESIAKVFKTRAAALRAANKQNDLEGLPRVA